MRESWCNPLRVLRRSRTSRRPSSVRAKSSAAKARARDLRKAWPALTPNQTRPGQSGANRRRDKKGIRGRVWRVESPESFFAVRKRNPRAAKEALPETERHGFLAEGRLCK